MSAKLMTKLEKKFNEKYQDSSVYAIKKFLFLNLNVIKMRTVLMYTKKTIRGKCLSFPKRQFDFKMDCRSEKISKMMLQPHCFTIIDCSNVNSDIRTNCSNVNVDIRTNCSYVNSDIRTIVLMSVRT